MKFSKNKIFFTLFLSALFILSIAFSNFMFYHWKFRVDDVQQRSWVEDKTFHLAKFMEGRARKESILTSNELLRRRLIANSYIPVFPLENSQILSYDYLKSSDLLVKPVMLNPFRKKTFWISQAKLNPKKDWATIVTSNLDSNEITFLIDYYKLGYVVENKNSNYIRKEPRWVFYKDLHTFNDKIYDNGLEYVYDLKSTS
jgi:hypothetical protein